MAEDPAIAEIVRRLVSHYHPERIYLFGSAARGEAAPDSDLDFLVVLPDDSAPELLRGGEVYRALEGVSRAVDVVPWLRSDFDSRARHVVASLPATVLREGKLLYEAGRTAG